MLSTLLWWWICQPNMPYFWKFVLWYFGADSLSRSGWHFRQHFSFVDVPKYSAVVQFITWTLSGFCTRYVYWCFHHFTTFGRYLGAILDEVAFLEAQVTQVVVWRHTLRQTLLSHLLQLQPQTQNFVNVIIHLYTTSAQFHFYFLIFRF